MKKFITSILIILLSVLTTFFVFEIMSWYHFGDIPTKVVLFRLIIFFLIILVIISGVLLLINKYIRKK